MLRRALALAVLLSAALPAASPAAGTLDAAGLTASPVGGGIVEPGSTVDVVASVRNGGTEAVTGLRGELRAAGDVVVERGTADFPDLEPGAVGSNSAAPFRLQLPAGAPCGAVTPLSLRFVREDGSATTVGFDLGTGVPGRPVTVAAGDLPQAVPDGAGELVSPVAMAGGGLVKDVRVLVDELRHARAVDLGLVLEAPDGTPVTVFQNGSGADLVDTVLADGGRPISSAAGPYGGTFAPSRPLATFAGRSTAGTWRLLVRDTIHGTTGTLVAWRLQVRPATCDPQVVPVLRATPATVLPGGEVAFDASASSLPDGDAVAKVEWDPEGDGTWVDGATALTRAHTYPVRGAYEAAVRITTASGLEGVERVLVPVTVPPVAALDAPAEVDSLDPVVLDAGASTDADGRIVRHEWDLDGLPGFEVDGGELATRTRSFPRSGDVVVGVRVTDDLGATATATRTIRVRNRAPVAVLAALPAVAVLGEPLALDGTASADPDGTIAGARFALDDGSAPLDGATLSRAPAPARTGTVQASLVVTDDEGAISSPAVRSTWVTARPVARIAGPGTPVGPRATVTLSGSGSSDDEAGLELAWDLDADGAFDDATGATATRSWPKAGDHTVRLRATDVRGIAHVARAVVQVRNHPPLATLTASPAPVAPGDVVVLDATGSSDPDGAALSFRFDLDGDGRHETAAGTTGLATRAFPSPGLMPVAVQVTDADGGVSVARALVEVRTPPPPAGGGAAPAPSPAVPAAPAPSAGAAGPAAAGPGVGTPPALGAPARARARSARPSLRAAKRQRRAVVLRRGVAVRCVATAVRCTVRATVSRADARRLRLARRPRGSVTIGRVTGRPGAARRIRLTRTARRRLARAARVTVVLRATATDAAGRRTTAVRAVVVRR